MGDYSKLIVSCTVKGSVKEELDTKIKELCLGDSAYHSQEKVISVEYNTWPSRQDELCVVLVGQTKYGRGQQEFCEWLKPHVINGSGPNDVFAMSFNEYGVLPTFYKLFDRTEDEL